jgi:hypothetical protein
MTDLVRLHAARLHADSSWQMFADQAKLGSDAALAWQEETTPEGKVLLSGRVAGPRAVWALDQFARDFHLHLNPAGDQRPQFDVSQPGRTVVVWRYGGVWVQLWHPEAAVDAPKAAEPVHDAPAPPVTVQATPEPKPKPAAPVRSPVRSLISRASGRLPYTRTRRKETPAA